MALLTQLPTWILGMMLLPGRAGQGAEQGGARDLAEQAPFAVHDPERHRAAAHEGTQFDERLAGRGGGQVVIDQAPG